MKKNLLIGILGYLCLVSPVKAQLQKGTKYFGTTVNLTGVHARTPGPNISSSNQMNIRPEIQFGKFISDNKMIGLGISTNLNIIWFKNNTTTNNSKQGTNWNQFSLSPYMRHYKSLNSKFAIFLNSSADLSYLRTKTYQPESESSENGYSIGLNIVPGIAYWITPRFALESDVNLFSLGVSYQDFLNTKSVNFNSAITSKIPQYFSVRASWYFQKN